MCEVFRSYLKQRHLITHPEILHDHELYETSHTTFLLMELKEKLLAVQIFYITTI
jgi:hypothetical protein